MSERIWKPNVTVAAIAEQDGRFLLVEEETPAGVRFNQPAGHLEPDESLLQAVVRECFEETGYHFQPEYLVGIYQWKVPENGVTYLRFAFKGRAFDHHQADYSLDQGIISAGWKTLEEIRGIHGKLRSPLVLACLEDACSGVSFPLNTITHIL